jgi:hypothetical protein
MAPKKVSSITSWFFFVAQRASLRHVRRDQERTRLAGSAGVAIAASPPEGTAAAIAAARRSVRVNAIRLEGVSR